MKTLVQFIYEMLKSHDTKELKKRIDEIYGDRLYSSEIIDASPEKLRIIKLIFNRSIDFYSNETKLRKYLKYYNYFVTWRRNYNDKHEVYIEPIYSDSISDKVYNEYNGIIYHVTKNEYLDSILKSGLRQRATSAKTYRYIPAKLYFSCADNESVLKSNLEYIKNEMFDDETDLVVLKININNHDGIEFYADPAFGSSKNIMCYAFVNIPKELIEIDKKKMTNYINDIHTNT